MRVDGEGWLPKGRIQHHVRGFSTHPGEGFQRFPVPRHLTPVVPQQNLAGCDHVLRLAVEESDVPNVAADPLDAKLCHRCGVRGFHEEGACALVYAHVRGLGGQNHGDEQLEGRVVEKLRGGLGNGLLEPGKDGFALGFIHFTGPVTRTRRAATFSARASWEGGGLSAWRTAKLARSARQMSAPALL